MFPVLKGKSRRKTSAVDGGTVDAVCVALKRRFALPPASRVARFKAALLL